MKADVIKALAVISASFQNFKLPPGGSDVWASMLEDLPSEALQGAVVSLCATSEFPPTIAAIRKAALACSPRGAQESALEAWQSVLYEISRVGWCRAPEFRNPVTARAVQCICNWTDLCGSDMDEMPSHRARFIEAYNAIASRVENNHLLPEALRRQVEQGQRAHIRGVLE